MVTQSMLLGKCNKPINQLINPTSLLNNIRKTKAVITVFTTHGITKMACKSARPLEMAFNTKANTNATGIWVAKQPIVNKKVWRKDF